jgi:hypothetical protein
MPFRRPFLLLSAAFLFGACVKEVPPPSLVELAEKLEWTSVPTLPAPESGTYLSFREQPSDDVIAALVRGKHYDGALASAGATLALDAIEHDELLSRWSLREALWRGGFPFPVYDARTWEARPGEPPPRDLLHWIEQISPDEAMALVRARGPKRDIWVGLRAQPELQLGALPRRTQPGAAIHLDPLPGAVFRLTDGVGRMYEGALDAGDDLLLTSSGEWLLEITRERRELVRLPIYVGIAPPAQPILRIAGDSGNLADAEDARDLARVVLDQVRLAYVMPIWRHDPSLDAAAHKVAASPPELTDRIVGALGYEREDVVIWTCDDVTVQNCIDRWLWDPPRRATLLGRSHTEMGLHAELDARGVHLTLVLGREA